MIYNSKKGWVLPIAITFMLIMDVIAIVNGVWPVIVITMIVIALFLWIWFDTYYFIKNSELFYKSGFIKGSVPVSAMHEIVRHSKGLHSCSLKPALALKGLIIKYNRWDDMFVSPENAGQFIAELQAINPDIKVTG